MIEVHHRQTKAALLGDRPAVLARQLGQQAQHERPGRQAGLHHVQPRPA
jgi:hypothetical protein